MCVDTITLVTVQAKGAAATEQQVYYDAKAAFQYLVDVCQIKLSEIIIYGQSVGSGPSIYLATKYECLGTVTIGRLDFAVLLIVFVVLL